jgi:hypothetical protein
MRMRRIMRKREGGRVGVIFHIFKMNNREMSRQIKLMAVHLEALHGSHTLSQVE